MCATCAKHKGADKKQDAKLMKTMSPKEKSAFKKEDAKADKKPMSAKTDAKMDAKIAKKVKMATPPKKNK